MATLRRAAILFTVFTILACTLSSIAGAQDTPPPTSSLIVKMVKGLSSGEQENVIASNGGTEISAIPVLQLHIVEVPTSNLPTVIQNYKADPRVISVEENKTRKSEAMPSDTYYDYQWALPKIGWDQVFGTMNPAGSATVAILDTGVNAAHPELADKIIPGTSILDNSNGLSDPNGHGTWMTGIVAANTNNNDCIAGVGYAGVKIMPVTVLGADATGQDSDIIAGIIWAADHGADIILMSFSNPGFSSNLQDAIDYAWAKNAVLVASVGNAGANAITFPAGDRGVVGVSATDSSDNLASFSNYGQDVFLAAPGTDIVTIDNTNPSISISGTSPSAAIVAGVSAFMKANDSTLTNGVIVGRLARTTDFAGTQEQTGNGRINMARALADTSTDPVEPAGSDPIGSGGPVVGPYVANVVTVTITATPSGAIGGTFVFSHQNGTSQTTITSTGTTPKTYSNVRNNSPYAVKTIQTPVNGHNYIGSTRMFGTFGSTGPYTITLRYGKASATVAFNNLTKTYTGSPLTPTAITSPAGLAVTWTGVPQTAAGSYAVKATVNNSNYIGSKSGTFTIIVAGGKVTPTITWNNPANITYPTALSGTQLNATASAAGTFTYTPAAGTMLNAGNNQILHVDFTPINTAAYNSTSKSVFINVLKCPATVTLSNMTQAYTGSPLMPTATTNPAGLGITWTGAPQTNMGSYAVKATVNNSNYIGSKSGTFIITGPVPAAPVVTSSTHPDQGTWYTNNVPSFTWTESASGITSYSYILNQTAATIPYTTSGRTTISSTTTSASYTGKATGTWYFHVQAKHGTSNWGAAAHYAVHIDITAPAARWSAVSRIPTRPCGTATATRHLAGLFRTLTPGLPATIGCWIRMPLPRLPAITRV